MNQKSSLREVPLFVSWALTADSVRDFAFAAGSQLRWDASAYKGTLVHTLYGPSAPEWEEANRMVREALQYFSEQWYPYPYSHITSVEGPIEGMEYPMLTFDPRAPSREERQWVLAHELGHQWMPMIVGSNERLYPWMDEGFNTFADIEGAEKYFAGTPYADTVGLNPLHLYAAHGVPGRAQVREAVAQLCEIAGPRGAERDSRQYPLEIADLGEYFVHAASAGVRRPSAIGGTLVAITAGTKHSRRRVSE